MDGAAPRHGPVAVCDSPDVASDPSLDGPLRSLEEALWLPRTRFDRAWMEAVLAPDFLEHGRSGRVWTREQVLDMPAGAIGADLPLADFSAAPVGTDVALVTYVGVVRHDGAVHVSNRSSLWVRAEGRWRLRFHQGTPAAGH